MRPLVMVVANRICSALGLAMMVLAAAPASAQPERPIGVFGAIELARITEDDGFLGAGWGGAGGVVFHVTEPTSIAIEIGRQRHVRDLEFGAVAFDADGRPHVFPYVERWEGTATFIVGQLAQQFGSARFRPVAWGGAGVMSHGGTRRGPIALPDVPPGLTRQPGDAVTRQGRSVTAFTYEGGFGVDIPLTGRLTLRPFGAVRLVNTGNVGPKYIIHSGGRLAFR